MYFLPWHQTMTHMINTFFIHCKGETNRQRNIIKQARHFPCRRFIQSVSIFQKKSKKQTGVICAAVKTIHQMTQFFFSGRNTNTCTVRKPPAESGDTVLHPSQSGGKSAGQELHVKNNKIRLYFFLLFIIIITLTVYSYN